MTLSVETHTAAHIGDRLEQQDRVALFEHPVQPGVMLAVVADGMGGHTGGAMAAEQVLFKAHQGFESFDPANDDPFDTLRRIVDEAHTVIKLTSLMSEQDPHSTIAVLLLLPGRAVWAHSGDSRIYHFRGDRLVTRSEDHSLVAALVRYGRLTPEESLQHPQRNMLLACLGAEHPPSVDFGEATDLGDRDTFLLCSDGLWAYFSEAELGGVLAVYPPGEAAEILIRRARSRCAGQGDNMSMAILRLTDAEVRQRESFRLEEARRRAEARLRRARHVADEVEPDHPAVSRRA